LLANAFNRSPIDEAKRAREALGASQTAVSRQCERSNAIGASKMDICSISNVGSQAMQRKNRNIDSCDVGHSRALCPAAPPLKVRRAGSAGNRVTSPRRRASGGRSDPRIPRTRALLHEALGSLIREKPYDRITVADILDRAKVSRSTFYIHFRHKDELLASSMRTLLLDVLSANDRVSPDVAEQRVAFSLPLLTHIHQHRRSAKARLGERGRTILHEHLRRVLSEWMVQTMERAPQTLPSGRSPIVPELLAWHIASTFVLILHWSMDDGVVRPPAEADKLFRALVMPVLQSPLRS
jgi:AcrR family transcriptional regulator